MPDQALANLRVLDLTDHIAGPYCTKLLADFGAEVIKIEGPGHGDPARATGPFFQDKPGPDRSGLFFHLNANKKSVTLNLETRAGIKLFKELVRDADVVVESFRPGVMPGLGLSYETLQELNPRLIVTSISNFGQSGPYQNFRATNLVQSALGGLMYFGGDPDREPLKIGGSQTDYVAGLNAFVATLVAVNAREDTGLGQHVDVSTLESVLLLLDHITILYSYLGLLRKRWFGRSTFGSFPAVQRCRDGYVLVIPGRDWQEFASWVGAPQLQEPRFSKPGGPAENAGELETILGTAWGSVDKEDLFHEAQQRRMAFGYVATTAELAGDAQNKARSFFVRVEHPAIGAIDSPGPPFKMSETPWQCKSSPPALGQHTEEVLGQIGCDQEQLVRLREMGVI